VAISVAIIVLLLTAMLIFFLQFMEVRKVAAANAARTQLARQVLDTMAAELRGCVGVDEIGFPMEQGQRLIGDRRSISFLTTALPARHQYEFVDTFEDPLPAQHDLRQVSYSLWIDPEETDENGEPLVGGLIRSVKRTLNQFLVDEEDPLDIRYDLWSHEIGYIEFRYFDGVEWDTVWDLTSGNSLPQLIQITVGFDSITNYELEDDDLDDFPLDQYPLGYPLEELIVDEGQLLPIRYSTIVEIPAADKLFGSRIQRLGSQLTDQLGVGGVSQ
jgi:hypothetical protein